MVKLAWNRILSHSDAIERDLSSTKITAADIESIKNSAMYSSIPAKIRSEFENMRHSGVKTSVELSNGREADIIIVEPSSSSSSSSCSIDVYMRLAIIWLRFASSFASPRCAKRLTVNILLTRAKKYLPDFHSDPIDTIHANTAFTTSCSRDNDIFIFRREEWLKVLFHESFHCMGLDFSAMSTELSTRRILSIFPALDKKTDVRLYESYCEIWAEIFNLIFSVGTGPSGQFRRAFPERRFLTALAREQVFSVRQSVQILRRSGYKYSDIFGEASRTGGPAAPSSSSLAPIVPYKENTPAFSYYVLKSALYWNIDQFVEWCASRNTAEIPIQFPLDQRGIDEYVDLVERLAKDPAYRLAVSRAEKNRHLAMDLDAKKTLRMTNIEPECLSV